MTLELVPWRGHTVPVLTDEIVRYTTQDYINWLTSDYRWSMGAPPPAYTTYGNRPAEPISFSFEGFVYGMLYADGPVAAAEAYRLRVFGQAPLLYQEIVDGRPGDFFDDDQLDRIRAPWPGATLSDAMKRALLYGDFAGNAFLVDMDNELVLVRPDWVEIVLAKRLHRGQQVGWKQVGIMYYEGGLSTGEGVPFLPGEYVHFVPGLPDPLASYRGMSWLTPLVREVQADKAAMDHKVAFFEHSASPNLAVSLPKEITPAQFAEFVDKMDAQHKGALNAGKTLYTAGGADVTVIGANMQQMDFSSVLGKGETRVANAAGVPPVLLSFSEGMQGSSLNAGNYTAAKRNFVDTTMRDLWQNFAGSVQQMDAFRPPRLKTRLWYDGRDIPFLHEDAKDAADIQQTLAATITMLVREGFTADSSKLATVHQDMTLLEHTGLTSVQLQPPGSQPSAADEGPTPYGEEPEPIDFGALREPIRAVAYVGGDISRKAPYPGQRYKHGWIPVGGLDLLGPAQTAEEIIADYGGPVDNFEFAEGAIVELGEDGTVHIDLAAVEPDKWHAYAAMTQEDAARLAEDLDWALDRADDGNRGHRPADPVNGLLDWRDDEGQIVGYAPDGTIRIGMGLPGQAASSNDVLVIDLSAEEAAALSRALSELASMDLPEEEQ